MTRTMPWSTAPRISVTIPPMEDRRDDPQIGLCPLNPVRTCVRHSISFRLVTGRWVEMGSGSRSRFKSRSAGITSVVEEPATESRSQRGVGTETPSQARMHRRLRGRLPLGGLLGAIAGAMVGALVGLLFFDRSAAVLTSILASTVFGLAVGMLVAGYSSLESPDPGAEPSDTARPVTDRPEVVREEHPEPPVGNQMPED
jgi:hypothetical protein